MDLSFNKANNTGALNKEVTTPLLGMNIPEKGSENPAFLSQAVIDIHAKFSELIGLAEGYLL